MLYDGCRVVYTGADSGSLRMDDQGAVMVLGERSAHVQWRTGSRIGEIDLVDTRDLLAVHVRQGAVDAALDDCLEVAGLGTFTARQIYDEGGAEGLLNAMVDAGHLASFTTIAEEALALVAGRLRASAALHTVTSHLEEAEAEDVVRTAAAALIRDAFNAD